MSGVERVELAPGYPVARVINGGWQLAADHSGRALDRERALADLGRLADAGFTTFDCADIYTGVEELLGELVRRRRAAAAPPIEIHTKYVPDRGELVDLARRDVRRAVERSLARLGVERLDLVQLHWWDFAVPGWLDAAGWLDELRCDGKLRLLGVTNFDASRLAELLDAGLSVVSDQVQYSLLDRRPERRLAGLCRRRGVRLLAYGTLAGGFLSDAWRLADEPTAAANRSQTKYRLILDECGGWPRLQELLEVLAAVAARHRATIANVAARWVLDRPAVAGVVLGARHAGHLEQNRRLLTLELDGEDRRRIGACLARFAGPRGPVYGLERTPGSPHRRILRTGLRRGG